MPSLSPFSPFSCQQSSQNLTQQEIDVITEINNDLETKVAELTEQIEASKQVCEEKDGRIDELEKQLSDHPKQGCNGELDGENGDLAERLRVSEDENAKRMNEMGIKVAELTELVNASKQACGERDARIGELETQISDSNQRSSDELDELDALTRKNLDLAEQLGLSEEEKRKIVHDTEQAHHEKDERISELETHIRESNNDGSSSEDCDELARQNEVLAQACDAKDGRIGELEMQLADDTNRGKGDELDELTRKNSELVEQLGHSEEEQQKTLEEHESLKELVEKGKAYVDQLMSQLDEANSSIDQKEDKIIELENQLLDLEELKEQQANASEEDDVKITESLKREIEEGKAYVSHLSTELAEAQRVCKERACKIDELEEKLMMTGANGEESSDVTDELRKQIAELTEQVNNAKEENQSIVADYDTLQQQIVEGKGHLSQLTFELAEWRQLCEEKEQKIGELQKQIGDIGRGSGEELQMHIQELTEQVKVFAEDNQKIAEDREHLRRQIEESGENLSQLMAELAERNKLHDDKEQRVNELEKQLVNVNNKCDELSEQIREFTEQEHIAKEENERISAAHGSLMAQIEAGTAHLSQLTSELTRLEQTCEEKERQIGELERRLAEVERDASDEAGELRTQIGAAMKQVRASKEELAAYGQLCEDKESRISELTKQLLDVNGVVEVSSA